MQESRNAIFKGINGEHTRTASPDVAWHECKRERRRQQADKRGLCSRYLTVIKLGPHQVTDVVDRLQEHGKQLRSQRCASSLAHSGTTSELITIGVTNRALERSLTQLV